MRLFFKHLLRSVRNRPWQPIVLVLTLALSIAVSITIMSLKSSIYNERALEKQNKYENSDIIISVNSNSESRFLFTDDVNMALGEDVACVGYYDVLFTTDNQEIFWGSATDLATFDTIFDIKFIEYGRISEDNLESAIIITPNLAKSLSLSVGDSLSLILFGKEVVYTVAGITSGPLLADSDVLVDISGVINILTEDSIFASVIGENFKPYSTILIDLPEGANIEEAIATLRMQNEFSDKTVSGIAGAETTFIIELVIDFCVTLSLVMTSIVAYSCFSILQRERSIENEAFSISGAKRSMLNFMQYAEVVAYWAASSLLGIPLSLPIVTLTNYFINFKYSQCEITVNNCILSVLMLLLSLLLTVTVFVFASGKSAKVRSRSSIQILIGVTILTYAVEFLIPSSLRFAFGIGVLLLVLLSVFLSVSGISSLLLSKIDANKRSRAWSRALTYAIKNVLNVKPLKNTMRLCALLCTTLLCILTVISGIRGNIVAMTRLFDAEYVVLNGTARTADKIKECDGISSLEMAYFEGTVYDNGYITTLLSVTEVSVLSSDITITKMPSGNEAIVTYAEAKMLSLDIGSKFNVEVGGITRELVVLEIIDTALNFILFDCEHFDINYTIMIPTAKEGVSNVALLKNVSAAIKDEVATVTKTLELFEDKIQICSVYAKTADILFIVILVFALIGLINTIAESYRVRRSEFELFRISGMSQSTVKRLKLYENAITLLTGIGFGIIGYLVALPLLNEIMYGMGFEMARNLMALFK